MIRLNQKLLARGLDSFRKRIAFIVDSTRQRAVTEVRRSAVGMRALARKNAPRATGDLRRSIVDTYANQGLAAIVGVSGAAGYADAVEGWASDYRFGRKPGAWPPPAPILKWVRIRGLARKWKMKEASVVFLVRRKIGRKGTKAQPSFKPAFDKIAPQFEARILKVFEQAANEAGGT